MKLQLELQQQLQPNPAGDEPSPRLLVARLAPVADDVTPQPDDVTQQQDDVTLQQGEATDSMHSEITLRRSSGSVASLQGVFGLGRNVRGAQGCRLVLQGVRSNGTNSNQGVMSCFGRQSVGWEHVLGAWHVPCVVSSHNLLLKCCLLQLRAKQKRACLYNEVSAQSGLATSLHLSPLCGAVPVLLVLQVHQTARQQQRQTQT